jgi:hypothetical protein
VDTEQRLAFSKYAFKLERRYLVSRLEGAVLFNLGLSLLPSCKKRDGTTFANHFSMMDVALSIFALVAGGVTLELFTVARAPMGYQDESGFHFGNEAKDSAGDAIDTGNPS